MRKIYKYKLGFEGEIVNIKARIEKILDIQPQGSDVVLWALINDDFPEKDLDIIAIGTGWDLPSGADEYLGTAQDEFGLVWHYFTVDIPELKKKEIKAERAPIGIDTIQFDAEALAIALGQIGFTAQEATSALNKVSEMWKDVL